MLPYLFVFFISIIATYNAQRCRPKSLGFYIHSCFAIIPLVLLAAFRDASIGTDTINYIHLFEDAVENKDNIVHYIFSHPPFEKGFLIYNFLIAQCIESTVIYFTITYGIIVGLAYASAIRLKPYISPHIFMFVYVFLFFSESLNVLRQYMAISFVLYGVSDLFIGRKINYIIWTVLACLFHTSAFISIAIGGTYWLTSRFPLHNHKLSYAILCMLVLIVAINMERLTDLGWLPMFEDKLDTHLTNRHSGVISTSHIIIYLYTFIVLLCSYKRNAICDLLMLTTAYTLLFFLSPNMNSILYRLTLYFNIMICISVAYTFRTSTRIFSRLNIFTLLILYIAFYIFSFVISGTQDVVPYSSSILGI